MSRSSLSRRNFLRSLPFIPAAVRKVATAAVVAAPKASVMAFPWFQTTRVTAHVSPAYTAALEKIMSEKTGSYLTHATIQPLTPAMFESLAQHETRKSFFG